MPASFNEDIYLHLPLLKSQDYGLLGLNIKKAIKTQFLSSEIFLNIGRKLMATYEYQCQQDGVIEISRPIGLAPESIICSVCGASAVRMISVPMIRNKAPVAFTAAIDRADKSRYEPEVVTSLPQTNRSKYPPKILQNPALKNLPRP